MNVMEHLWLVGLAGGLLVAIVISSLVWYANDRRKKIVRQVPLATGWVRVLRTQQELREAAERALGIEQVSAREIRDRISRYETLSGAAADEYSQVNLVFPFMLQDSPEARSQQ